MSGIFLRKKKVLHLPSDDYRGFFIYTDRHMTIEDQELQLKTSLCNIIISEISKRFPTQKAAADYLGVPASYICMLFSVELRRFRIFRLMKMINKLGMDISIQVYASNRREGRVSVNIDCSTLTHQLTSSPP